tara:strand:+ start:307 stop:636 length:330 start_codon:yes stop_codon:yes gene_type:complete
MALTLDEFYNIEREMRKHRANMRYYEEYSKRWTEARLELERLQGAKKTHHMVPKVGDLITDEQYPDDGVALVLEVGDRRRESDVYRVLAPKGVMWLNKGYVEYQCRLLS